MRRSRRLLAAATALVAFVACSDDSASNAPAQPEPEPVDRNASLREIATHSGLRIGAAIDAEALQQDPAYADAAATHFNSLTPEDAMKWTVVQPQPGEWDFSGADALVDFAEEHDMTVRGHTLVWGQDIGNGMPDWARQISDPDELREALREYGTTLMTRYADSVERWDVVNEPLLIGEGELDPNPFFEVLGPEYIAEAFELAHEVDPDAELWLNEHSVEHLPAKADALVALVADLIEQGVPIDGVGLQTHQFSSSLPPAGAVEDVLGRLRALGVDVAITELDLPLDDARDLEAQAAGYRQIVDECLAAGCAEISVWGVDDGRTWLDEFLGAGPHEPLLLDTDYRPKPAYDAVRDAILATQASP